MASAPELPAFDLLTPVVTPEADDVTRLEFKRRANGGDLIAAGFRISISEDAALALESEQVCLIASRCCEVPEVVIRNLDSTDFVKVYMAVMGMLFRERA